MVKKENEQAFQVVPTHVSLLPCPFCGGSAEVVVLQRGVPGVGDVYGCVCLSCCSVGKPFDNPFDSAEFWNTRTSV